jgi:hypothetical protein
MKRAFITLCLLWACPAAFSAGALYGTTVVGVRVDGNGKGVVFFSQPIAGTPPSCVISTYNNGLAFDATTDGGKAVLAWALSAKAAGTSVAYVFGTGACSVYTGSVEDWYYGVTQ